jgi:hypothetical protein
MDEDFGRMVQFLALSLSKIEEKLEIDLLK